MQANVDQRLAEIVRALDCRAKRPFGPPFECPRAGTIESTLSTAMVRWADLDVHEQRVVTQVAALGTAGTSNKVLVVPSQTDLRHPALHRIGHTRR